MANEFFMLLLPESFLCIPTWLLPTASQLWQNNAEWWHVDRPKMSLLPYPGRVLTSQNVNMGSYTLDDSFHSFGTRIWTQCVAHFIFENCRMCFYFPETVGVLLPPKQRKEKLFISTWPKRIWLQFLEPLKYTIAHLHKCTRFLKM